MDPPKPCLYPPGLLLLLTSWVAALASLQTTRRNVTMKAGNW